MTRYDEYRRCAAAGMSQAETAAECGVSRQAVEQFAKKYGVSFKHKDSRTKGRLVDALLSTVADYGLNNAQAAEAIGVTGVTIWRAKRRTGISLPNKPKAHPAADKIRELAMQGMTVSEVAAALGIPQPNVSAAKKKFGIQFHRDGRAA